MQVDTFLHNLEMTLLIGGSLLGVIAVGIVIYSLWMELD